MTRTLDYGFAILQEFRKLDPEIPLQTASAFMLVASRPGVSMDEIGRTLNMSQASVSRNVAALSVMQKKDKPGHGLVQAKEDPEDRRRKLVDLTEKGTVIASRVAALVGSGMHAA